MSWLGTTDDPASAQPESPKIGYRVDLWQHQVGAYMEYTSLKTPVTREMAEALGRGLKRQGAGGRIVEVPSGKVVEEWPVTKRRTA